MYRCYKCKEKFDTLDGNFYKNKYYENGHDKMCKTCRKEDNSRRYREKHGIVSIEKFTCTRCNKRLELTTSNFAKANGNTTGFSTVCKSCRSIEKKKWYAAKKLRKAKKAAIKAEEERMELDKMYARVMAREEEIEGLKISEVKLKLNKEYSIKIPRREGSTKDHYFVGSLIQDCNTHVVLKSKKGYCQSFMKVDLLLEHECKEIN